ncbi:hypothetical protein BHE74_00013861, partial [Ensete ventricosum]
YNKRDEDFPSRREYNDYLEEVEDMSESYNLIEGIDVAAIEAEIAKHQEENADQIINARARKGAGPSAQGIDVSNQGQYAPTSMLGGGLMQPHPTGMAPQPIPVGAPPDPLQGYATDDEETMKLRAERGGKAGGWTTELSKRRALEEAFSSIWI